MLISARTKGMIVPFLNSFFILGITIAYAADMQSGIQSNSGQNFATIQNAEKYTIQPQDKLNIQVAGENDLCGVFVVGPQGDINYPLLGAVYIQGLSLGEVKDFLTDSLGKKYLVNPRVQVTFSEMPQRSISEKSLPASVPTVPSIQDVLAKVQNTKSDNSQDLKSEIMSMITPSPATKAESLMNYSDAGATSFDSDIIDTGDKLNIQVYKEPDLSGVFSVNSSGKINYPLLGEVYAQSLSLEELKQFLYDKLNEKYVTNPQIEITITESSTKSVSMLGQINKPGNYILTHHLTLLKLISQNGGFTPDASTKNVRIVRTNGDGKKETLEVDVDKVIQGLADDVILRSGDIIFVDFRSKEEVKKEVAKNYITLLGQVAKPGNYFYSPKLTLIRLIGEAGGFSPSAATNRIKIVRNGKDGKQQILFVDAGRIMGGGVKDLEVEEGDLIIVPESYF